MRPRCLAEIVPKGKVMLSALGPPFRVPLHSKHRRRTVIGRYRFHHPIGPSGIDDEPFAKFVHRLIMHAVHAQCRARRKALQRAARRNIDLMPIGKGLIKARLAWRMVRPCQLDIPQIAKTSAQRHIDFLQAPANPEHRLARRHGRLDQRRTKPVAPPISRRLRRIVRAIAARFDIGIAAGKKNRIEPRNDIGGVIFRLIGRNNHRQRLGIALHRFEIAVLDRLGRLAFDHAFTGDYPDKGQISHHISVQPNQNASPPSPGGMAPARVTPNLQHGS